MLRAQAEHERRAWRRTAQLASWIMAAWRGSQDTPSAAQLLGEPDMAPEEAEQALAQLIEGPQASVDALDRALAVQAERKARAAT